MIFELLLAIIPFSQSLTFYIILHFITLSKFKFKVTFICARTSFSSVYTALIPKGNPRIKGYWVQIKYQEKYNVNPLPHTGIATSCKRKWKYFKFLAHTRSNTHILDLCCYWRTTNWVNFAIRFGHINLATTFYLPHLLQYFI